MSTPAVPLYFELSWSILSTLGLASCGISLSVAGVVGFSFLSFVPIVTSAAGALANGLCYFAFYANYSTPNRLVAAAVADFTWLIQEAGLGFYSYIILRRLLRGRERVLFFSVFWSLMIAIAGLRIGILIERAMSLLIAAEEKESASTLKQQHLINHLHVAYFVLIAVAETVSSIFLLRIFGIAHRRSNGLLNARSSLFKILSRSTEIRLALLAPVGITRSITYTFQVSSQSATNTASQLDRFAYSLECIFPIVLIVDLLASKRLGENAGSSQNNRSAANTYPRAHGEAHGGGFSTWRSRVVTAATAGKVQEGDEVSLTPAQPGEIMLRTTVKQSVTRLEHMEESRPDSTASSPTLS